MAVIVHQPRTEPPRRTLLGLLLIVPAAIALVVAYVIPAIWTVSKSFTKSSPFGGSGEWVGGDNYQRISDAGLGRGIGYALSLAIVPALLVTLAALPLALLAHRAGGPTRWLTRVVLALPLALVTPVGLALGWQYEHGTPAGGDTTGAVREAVWFTTAGLAVAIGVTLFLAVLRPSWAAPAAGADPGGTARRGVLVVGVLALLAAAALGLQQFTYPFVATGFPRAGGTPMTAMLRAAFQTADTGQATAIATVMLVLLGGLGVAATVLVIVSGLRIEVGGEPRSAGVDAPDGTRPAGRAGAGRAGYAIGAIVGALAILAVVAYGSWPWLERLGDTTLPGGLSSGRVLVNTWLPPLVSTGIGISTALVGAIGIGVLRPFGRASEWLLLPFGVWLFVGSGPQLVHLFFAAAEAGIAGTGVSLLPTTWVLVPALFVLTLLFRGQRARWDRMRAAGVPASIGRTFVLPAIPMVVLLGGVAWLVQAQDLARQFVSSRPDLQTGPTAAVMASVLDGPEAESGLGLVLPPLIAVLLLVAALALQLAYVDRVALRTGPDAAPALGPDGAPTPGRDGRSADRGEQFGAARAG